MKSRLLPDGSETTILLNPLKFPSTERTNKVPSPAGIVAPESEKPNAVVALVDTINPFAAASPPDALTIVAPSVLN